MSNRSTRFLHAMSLTPSSKSTHHVNNLLQITVARTQRKQRNKRYRQQRLQLWILLTIPKSVEHSVRIEVRWAPNDFHELRASKEKMFSRLAPILSCFNTQYTWMLEWQTYQMEDSVDINPKQLAKYLSIRIVPVVKERAFYFSFRICATGSQFTQVAKSAIMKTAKSGERMSFDPTSIPPQQGELIFVGDILLKDASNTHRGHYLRYLRKEVLPEDTPAFDIKVRHKDPVGNPVKILAVRCGKATSIKVAEIHIGWRRKERGNLDLSSRFGANQTSKKEHA